MPSAEAPEFLLRDRRIVVCVGTGGVGKTTVAAALALDAARRGLRTLVLTIDPARRLADALGIRELGNEPRRIESPDGEADLEFYAMMLDPKRTFDGLIERFATDEAARRKILDNPIYENISGAMSGSGEYAAMEKVLEMSESGRFDLVVVDTPPAQHVLEFLEAPRRLIEFLDSRLVKLLVHPAMAAGRFGVRLFQRPIHAVLHLLERVTGVGFLEDLSAFLMAIDDLSDGFKQRADRIQQTLLGEETAFVLVAGPGRESSQNALLFLEHLEKIRASLQGVIINRMHLWPGAGAPSPDFSSATVAAADLELLSTALGDRKAAQAAITAARDCARDAERDFESTRSLYNHAQLKNSFFRTVPELPRDVHDLESLSEVAAALVGQAKP